MDVYAACMNVLKIYICVINLVAFAAYGIDKSRAKTGRWRIPEKTLLLLAVIGGSIGALAGMYFYHHKTRKPKFYIGNWAILVAQVLLSAWIWYRI